MYFYYLPLPPRLPPPLLRPIDEPEDLEGGDTEPRELLPREGRGAALGREGREGAALGRRELAGRAGRDVGRRVLEGRALLPDGRRDEDGRTPLEGRREVPGLTTPLLGLRDELPGRTPSRVRVPIVPRVALPRVAEERVSLPLPRLATVRVEMRPFASRLMAVREAVRVLVLADRVERLVLTSMPDRYLGRVLLVRLSTMMPG